MTRRQYFTAGFKDGIPICLGYIAVSFTFGIMAKKIGISDLSYQCDQRRAVCRAVTDCIDRFLYRDGHHTAYYQLKILSDVLCAFAED